MVMAEPEEAQNSFEGGNLVKHRKWKGTPPQ